MTIPLRLSAALLAAVPAVLLAAPPQAPSAAELAERVQRRYTSVRDFSADFTQTYQGGVLRQKTTERGSLLIKKPGRMRWTYTAPEKKEFVSDGRRLYSYLPADKQVHVNDLPAAGADTSAALFLAGRGDLTRDFTAEIIGQDGATYSLKLTPKQTQQDFDTLTLIVDRESMRIQSLVATDRQGGTSTFVFSNFRENIGLADSRFEFRIPRGVKVVYAPMADIRLARALRAASLALALALAAGCATTSALGAGQRAEQLHDYDRAVAEYTKAVREEPDSREARAALDRARLRAADAHFSRGRRLAAQDRFEEALSEFQIANELNPASADIEDALRRARGGLRAKLSTAGGETPMEALVKRARHQPPPGLDLPEDVTMPTSLVTGPRTTSRELYQMLAKLADVNLIFDPDFVSAPAHVDLRGSSLRGALDAISGSTRTFWRVTAPRTITIAPDTAAKRREYQAEVVRTFYLSNADIKETIDLLRVVVDARQVFATTATNSITIRDTPERIEAVGRLLGALDKARPEVVVDIELLEVDRDRFREYGLQIASAGSPGIDGGLGVDEDGLTLRGLRSLSQSDVIVFGLPQLYYRLLKTDANTRTLASPHIRMSDGIATTARFGERVPVPVTTFVPIASGGVNQQPITSVVYENIGVNIDILPRLHHDDQVTLNLKVEVSSVAGEGFQGLPTFGSRAVSTTIRLRDGETNILAGLIRDDERTVLNGVPGLSDLPIIGRLFARNERRTKETDIVITMTPHIIRVLDLTEEDLEAFRFAGDGGMIFPTAGDEMVDVPRTVPRDPLPLPSAEAAEPPGPAVQPGVPLSSLPTTATPIKPPVCC